MIFKDASANFANITHHTCPFKSRSPSPASISLSKCHSALFPAVVFHIVHSSHLNELIAGLTALVQYTAQLLPGPHTAQPSHRAIRPPSRFLHRSPLSCYTPASGGFVSHPSLDSSAPLLSYFVIHLSSFSFYFHPTLSISVLLFFLSISEVCSSPFHPLLTHLLPLISAEGVRSVINNRLVHTDLD